MIAEVHERRDQAQQSLYAASTPGTQRLPVRWTWAAWQPGLYSTGVTHCLSTHWHPAGFVLSDPCKSVPAAQSLSCS